MTPRKAHIHAAFFAYGGNGGMSMFLPEIGFWWAKVRHTNKSDERIEKWTYKQYSDTPITMTRNMAVQEAKSLGADYLLMVDSDNHPDCEPDGKPFWETSFDFLYKHYEKGPALIFAPYCGLPANECPYVFKWTKQFNAEDDNRLEAPLRMAMMEREEAAAHVGIKPVAAGPTGLMLIDMRLFDVVEPPYFAYEYNDKYETEKGSTEDVYFTRNASLAGIKKFNFNPIYCNFDSWAGHAKQKMVRKPRPLTPENVAESLTHTILRCHAESGKPVVPEASSAPVSVSGLVVVREGTQDIIAIKEVGNDNCYRLPEKFAEGSVVIDVGAHIGIFALECLKRGASRVICFEPEDSNFELLTANTKHDPRCVRFKKAVWRNDATEPVHLSSRADKRATAMHYAGPARFGPVVPSVSLDSVLSQFDRVDLLKLDCEGAEYPILATSTQLGHVQKIVMELHHKMVPAGWGDVNVEEILCDSGFEYEIVPDAENPDYTSLVFAHRFTKANGNGKHIASIEPASDYKVGGIVTTPPQAREALCTLVRTEEDRLGGITPNVATIEYPDGMAALLAADAGAWVYTIREKFGTKFMDAYKKSERDTIDFLRGSAHQWAQNCHVQFDVLYIEKDFESLMDWLRRVKPGGVVCGPAKTLHEVAIPLYKLDFEFKTGDALWTYRIPEPAYVT